MLLYRLARLYRTLREKGESTASLDAFLAYRPWEDAWKHHTYIADVLLRYVLPARLVAIDFFHRGYGPFPLFNVCTYGEGWCTVIDFALNDDGVAEWREGALTPLYEFRDAVPYLRALRKWARYQKDRPARPMNSLVQSTILSPAHAYVFGFDNVALDWDMEAGDLAFRHEPELDDESQR